MSKVSIKVAYQTGGDNLFVGSSFKDRQEGCEHDGLRIRPGVGRLRVVRRRISLVRLSLEG